mgnify:CR=1 FL=1
MCGSVRYPNGNATCEYMYGTKQTMLSVILQITVFAVLGNAALLWIDRRLHTRAA